MDIEKALGLSQTYGVATVMLFMMTAFLAWLIYYVLKQNERREARLVGLTETHITALAIELRKGSESTAEFRRIMSESQRYQREEHGKMIEALEKILDNQK